MAGFTENLFDLTIEERAAACEFYLELCKDLVTDLNRANQHRMPELFPYKRAMKRAKLAGIHPEEPEFLKKLD